MFNRILKEMQEKIRHRAYVMTLHAEEEMDDDCLTIYDVESGILTGKILERQKDRETAEWKYRINEPLAKLSKLVIPAELLSGNSVFFKQKPYPR